MTDSFVQGGRMLRHALEALFVSSTLIALANTARAQSYTSQVTTGTFSSISGTGTLISLNDPDDGYGSFTAPFTFPWFGGSILSGEAMYVNSNGLVAFGTFQTAHSNVLIPTSGSPDNFAAPFWDDLVMTNGDVYYHSNGTTLTIEWANAAHYNTPTDTFSFQVKFLQSTGVVEFWYGPRTVTGTWNSSIGVENSVGSGIGESCSPSCTPASFASGTVVRYTPAASANVDLQVSYVDPLPSSVNAGQSYSLTWEVYNGGSSSSNGSDIGIYAGLSSSVTTNDFLVAYQSFSSVASFGYTSNTFSATIPSEISGSYYVAAIVDPFSSQIETNETNNTYALGSIFISGSGGVITITTEFLPNGNVDSFYNQQLTQTGGSFPTWSIDSGSLPPGLTLTASGSINGTPTTPGTYSFGILCSESGKSPGFVNLSITINAGGGPTLTTTVLPPAIVGVPYSAMLTASGGTPPYRYTLSDSPDWLAVDMSTGRLSGTPITPGTAVPVHVTVFDNSELSSNATLYLDITMPTELAINLEVPDGTSGDVYNAQVAIGGMPPYMITVASGMLPPGLMFNDTGALVGTPNRVGSYTAMISIADSATPPATVMGQLMIEVMVRTGLQIDIGEELAVYTNTDARVMLKAEGGTPPYTWDLVQGQLQPGLTLQSDGFIVGRVMMASTATVTLRVTDMMSMSDSAVVYVKAQPFRTMGGRTGGGRDDGCGCDANQDAGAGGSVFVLSLLGLVLLFRRRS